MEDLEVKFAGGFVRRDPDCFVTDDEGCYESDGVACTLAGRSALLRLRYGNGAAHMVITLGHMPSPFSAHPPITPSAPIIHDGRAYAAVVTSADCPLSLLGRQPRWSVRLFDLERTEVMLGIRRPASVAGDDPAYAAMSSELLGGLPAAMRSAEAEYPRMFDDFRRGVSEGEVVRLLAEQAELWRTLVARAEAMDRWRLIGEGETDKALEFETATISSWEIGTIDKFAVPAPPDRRISGGLLSLSLREDMGGLHLVGRTVDGVERSIPLSGLAAD
jgi:hypothetical protein